MTVLLVYVFAFGRFD